MATAAAPEAHREGARWINGRPSAEEFAEWFLKNTPTHDGALKLEDYIGGMVLIPAEETVKIPETAANGNLMTIERKQMVYIPYPKVETRLQYFWDLMKIRKDEWRAVIEPVEVPGKYEGEGNIPAINKTLPPGFIIMPVPVAGGSYSYFLVSCIQISIYERSVTWERGPDGLLPSEPPIMSGRGTKQVSLTKGRGDKTWADDNAIMKAETGAKGRALGFLSMLAVPGAGVATAEDMIEALAGDRAGVVQGTPEPQLPETPPNVVTEAPAPGAEITTPEQKVDQERQELLARAKKIIAELPGAQMEQFREWASARKPPVRNIGNLEGGALKGTVKRLEKLLVEAEEQEKNVIADEPETGDAPE